MGNPYSQRDFDQASNLIRAPIAVVPRDWVEAHQMFALSLSRQLVGRPCFTDLFSTSVAATDNTWSSGGGIVFAGNMVGGGLGLGAFADSSYVYAFGQAQSTGSYIKSPRHGMWFCASRAAISVFATNAGSRQFLIGMGNAATTIGLGYIPSVSTTNLVLCHDTLGTVNSSVISSELRRLSLMPDTDWDLFFDGVTCRAFTGDPLNGVAMREIAELTATEPFVDASGYTGLGHVRINVEAGGPIVNYDKILTIGTIAR